MGGPGTVNINETTKLLVYVVSNGRSLSGRRNAGLSPIRLGYLTRITRSTTLLSNRGKRSTTEKTCPSTSGLLKEGENVLEIAVMARSGEKSHLNYMLAIEAMVVSSHESIVKHCLNQSRRPRRQSPCKASKTNSPPSTTMKSASSKAPSPSASSTPSAKPKCATSRPQQSLSAQRLLRPRNVPPIPASQGRRVRSRSVEMPHLQI